MYVFSPPATPSPMTHGAAAVQIWLQNQSGMENTLSSAVAKISSAISSTYNCFLGQTRSQARLNAIASYDQSNELFKVCTPHLISAINSAD